MFGQVYLTVHMGSLKRSEVVKGTIIGARVGLPKIKDTMIGKKKTTKKERKNPFVALGQYLKDVRSEFKKVIWPDRATIISGTIVVLTALAFFTAYTGAFDFLFSKMISAFLP